MRYSFYIGVKENNQAVISYNNNDDISVDLYRLDINGSDNNAKFVKEF